MHADLNTVCVPQAFMLHSSFRVLILCFPCERKRRAIYAEKTDGSKINFSSHQKLNFN